MNRDTLQKFDPMPMTLGERTTRLPAAPVNPRAEYEAFERGVHPTPDGMARAGQPHPDLVRLAKYQSQFDRMMGKAMPPVYKPFDATVAKSITDTGSAIAKSLMLMVDPDALKSRSVQIDPRIVPDDDDDQPISLRQPRTSGFKITVSPEAAKRNTLNIVAVQHKDAFGKAATMRVLQTVGGANYLNEVPEHKIDACIAALQGELNVARDPEPDDGEGDTPDLFA